MILLTSLHPTTKVYPEYGAYSLVDEMITDQNLIYNFIHHLTNTPSHMKTKSSQLKPAQQEELLQTLKTRFEKNMNRHKGIDWSKVEEKLKANSAKLWSLYQMEETGGEPDVISDANKTGEYLFIDCAAESPKGRRSLCYDEQALESRKEHKPQGSAMGMASEMGVELLTEEEYRRLQTFVVFDTKTSSWVQTPVEIRKLGGALFCDRRYNQVFVYHNGAESYYAARAFRASLKV